MSLLLVSRCGMCWRNALRYHLIKVVCVTFAFKLTSLEEVLNHIVFSLYQWVEVYFSFVLHELHLLELRFYSLLRFSMFTTYQLRIKFQAFYLVGEVSDCRFNLADFFSMFKDNLYLCLSVDLDMVFNFLWNIKIPR